MVAASEYFRSQTWQKRNNSENPKVTLTNISSEALQWVIHFCYTGSLGKLVEFTSHVHMY